MRRAITYHLSLHDALPISRSVRAAQTLVDTPTTTSTAPTAIARPRGSPTRNVSALTRHKTARLTASLAMTNAATRSEEHTSELQSHSDLVCRLLLEKKNDP